MIRESGKRVIHEDVNWREVLTPIGAANIAFQSQRQGPLSTPNHTLVGIVTRREY